MEDKSENLEELTLLDKETDGNKESDGPAIIGKIKGIVSAFLLVIFQVVSASSVQLLERRIPDFELNAIRYGLPLVIFSIGILVTRRWPVVERREIIATTIYSVNAFLHSVAFYSAASLLPVATVQSERQTTNILCGILLFYLFLDDKPTILVLISSLMCVCGVVLVIQPPFIFVKGDFFNKSVGNEEDGANETTDFAANFTQKIQVGDVESYNGHWLTDVLKYLLPVAAGLVLTLDVIVVKKRPYLTEHIIEVLFWSYVSNTVLSVVVMAIIETPVLPGNWYDALLVTVHSMLCAILWALYLNSLRYISGNTFNVICSTAVVFLLVAQYTVLSTILPGNRNWIEVVGMVLVLLGSGLGSTVELCKDINASTRQFDRNS